MTEEQYQKLKSHKYTDDEIAAYSPAAAEFIKNKTAPKSFIESKKDEVKKQFQEAEKSQSTEIAGAAIPNSVLIPTAIGTGLAGAGMAYKAGKNSASTPRVDPVLDATPFREPAFDVAPNAAPAGPTPEQIAEQTRIAKQQQAMGQMNAPQPAPIAEVPQAPQTPNVLQEKLASIQAAQQPAPPVIKAPDAPPTASQLQVNPATSAIDEAGNLKVPEVLQPKEVAGDLPTVKKKGAPTLGERAAKVAEFENLAKNAPEGMIPNKFPNKVGQEVIGRGGYNHAYALFGEETPERWMEKYGPKNVPYETVRDDISAARRPMPATATGVESVNARPKYVPEYIKGAALPGMLGTLIGAGLTAREMAPLISKGSYAGAALSGLDTATDIHPATAAAKAIIKTLGYHPSLNDGENEWLSKRNYEQKVGGGRGVAPPSSYVPANPKKEWEELKKAGLVFGNYRG